MNWYLAVLKKYAVFSGRARRKEYWMFCLFSFVIAFILGIIEGIVRKDSASDGSILMNIYQIAVFIPYVAVGVRRMHDVGKKGWFLLIPIYNFILAATEGAKGSNQYGADPKASDHPETSVESSVVDETSEKRDRTAGRKPQQM